MEFKNRSCTPAPDPVNVGGDVEVVAHSMYVRVPTSLDVAVEVWEYGGVGTMEDM